MSFLDNLENNLKSLENAEQNRDEAERRGRSRDIEQVEITPFNALAAGYQAEASGEAIIAGSEHGNCPSAALTPAHSEM